MNPALPPQAQATPQQTTAAPVAAPAPPPVAAATASQSDHASAGSRLSAPKPKERATIDPAERRARFGSFGYSSRGGGRIQINDQGWLKNIITVVVPFNGSTQRMQIHRGIAQSIHEVFQEIEADHASRGYPYKLVFDGSFVPRQMASGTGSLSNHAWGIAIDLNAKTNPMRSIRGRYDLPSWVIDAFRRHGFRWGGDWTSPFDPMHFEYNRPDTALKSTSTLELSVNGGATSATEKTGLTLIRPDSQRMDAPEDRAGKTGAIWLPEAPPGVYRVELRHAGNGQYDLCATGYTASGDGATARATGQGKKGQTTAFVLTWDGANVVTLAREDSLAGP
ncbi:MAG: M15 family metallopeptidase [Chloroflexota bacterium]